MKTILLLATLLPMAALAEVPPDATDPQLNKLNDGCIETDTSTTKIKNCMAVNHEARIDALEGATGGALVPVIVDANGGYVASVINANFNDGGGDVLIKTSLGVHRVRVGMDEQYGTPMDFDASPIWYTGPDCTGDKVLRHSPSMDLNKAVYVGDSTQSTTVTLLSRVVIDSVEGIKVTSCLNVSGRTTNGIPEAGLEVLFDPSTQPYPLAYGLL